MKKRNLLVLGLIALMAVVVFVSCMQDPILDNKAIGKWIAENNMGDKLTLDMRSDQTLTMKLVQDTTDAFHSYPDVLSADVNEIEITVHGEWTASSISEGKIKIKETGAELTFTAYDKELIITNIEQHVSITFSHM